MAQTMVPRRGTVVSEPLRREMALQMAHLRMEILQAQHGLCELRTLHGFAAEQCHQTLAQAQQLMQTAEQYGGLSPLQRAALYHLSHAYVYEMLLIAEQTGDAIVVQMEHG